MRSSSGRTQGSARCSETRPGVVPGLFVCSSFKPLSYVAWMKRFERNMRTHGFEDVEEITKWIQRNRIFQSNAYSNAWWADNFADYLEEGQLQDELRAVAQRQLEISESWRVAVNKIESLLGEVAPPTGSSHTTSRPSGYAQGFVGRFLRTFFRRLLKLDE